jgi:ribose-phosphate pyrophosphokinase
VSATTQRRARSASCDGAVARITASRIEELVITDPILPTEAVGAARNIRVCGIAALIGEAIARTAHEKSVSSLFD